MDKTVGFFGGKFLPFHLGHLYAIVSASNQVDELYVVLCSSEKRDREFAERDDFPYIPPEVRLSWIGKTIADMGNVHLIEVKDKFGITDYNWEKGSNNIKKAIGKPITHIFTSENGDLINYNKYYPAAKKVVVDADRKAIPVSATKLRNDFFNNWQYLPKSVQPDFVKRVLITGTESCGKSTAVKNLAKIYNTNFVHEIGRDYSEVSSDRLVIEDFDKIAIDHYAAQIEKQKSSNKVLFVDSDAVVTQYYLDIYFNKNSKVIKELAKIQNYDLVLYFEPDVPWVADGFRNQGEEKLRKKNNEKLKKMYKDLGIEYIEINGGYNERFVKSKNEVDSLLGLKIN